MSAPTILRASAAAPVPLRPLLATVTGRVAAGTDRQVPGHRGELELAVSVLERLADAAAERPVGSGSGRLGDPAGDPTVVLLRRLAHAHRRLLRLDAAGRVGAAAVACVAGLADAVDGGRARVPVEPTAATVAC